MRLLLPRRYEWSLEPAPVRRIPVSCCSLVRRLFAISSVWGCVAPMAVLLFAHEFVRRVIGFFAVGSRSRMVALGQCQALFCRDVGNRLRCESRFWDRPAGI